MASYTAPDGSTFGDLRQYQRHIFNTYFKFTDRDGEELVKYPGEVNGQEFHLSKLSNCKVMVLDYMDRAVVTELQNCQVFVGPAIGTISIRKCVNCSFVVAAKEVRMGASSECKVNYFSPSPLQLDDCYHIEVGHFNGGYSGLTQHFESAGLDVSMGGKVQVVDFSAKDQSLPTPHYTVQSSGAVEDWMVDIPNAAGPPENPLKPSGETNPPPAPMNPPPELNPTLEPEQGGGADDEFFGGEEEDQRVESQEGDDMFGAENGGSNDYDPFGEEEIPTTTAAEEQDFDQMQQQSPQPDDYDPFGEEEEAAPSEAPSAPVADFGEDDAGDLGLQADEPFQEQQQEQQDDLVFQEQDEAAYSPPIPPQQAAPVMESNTMSAGGFDDEDSSALVKWEAEFKSKIASIDQEHAQKRRQMKEKAEEELEEHYSEITNRNAVRFSSNREAEKAYLETNDPSSSNLSTWARVASLIDVNAKDQDGPDRSRIRKILLQMKNS